MTRRIPLLLSLFAATTMTVVLLGLLAGCELVTKGVSDQLLEAGGASNGQERAHNKMVFVSQYCEGASPQEYEEQIYEYATRICVMNADGTELSSLTKTSQAYEGGNVSFPTWSPDGKKIAFVSNYRISTMNANGSNLTHITDTKDVKDRDDLAWSPDGKQIGFTGWESECLADSCDYGSAGASAARVPYIFVMNADGSGESKLLDRAGAAPAWSPDGKEIVFYIPKDLSSHEDAYYWICDLYAMNANGSGKPSRLTDDPGCDSSPDWSPDGTKIVFVRDMDIYVMNADGTSITGLTNTTSDTEYDHSPVWSPDGKKIAFVRTDNMTGSTIYTMNVDGSNLTPVRKFAGANGVVKSLDW